MKNNFIIGIMMAFFLSGCAHLLFPTEDYESIGKDSCKRICSSVAKSYQGYDKRVGCYCGKLGVKRKTTKR